MVPVRTLSALSLALILALVGCEEVEQMVDRRRPATEYEAYLAGLHQAGLAGTALTRTWIHQGGEAIRSPLAVDLPFREEGFIDSNQPDAVGYRVRVERGQILTVRYHLQSEEGTRVFLDLLRLPEDPADPPRPVEADTLRDGLQYEPFRTGDFVVRIQPELLRGGRYEVLLTLDPALAFPVSGHSMRSIQSWWGAPREGGRRRHEGVDIFARRGTPVVASVAGRVSRVRDTRLGGKVVWLRDRSRRRSIYYAHLDSQAVVAGQEVEVGDTLGFVGNTGNARTTPPHLHYGVYYRGEGAVDPAPFLRSVPGRLAEVEVPMDALGQWRRVKSPGVRLRARPSLRSDVVAELDRATPARVLAASAGFYRVRLPDGREGYLSGRVVEPLAPVETLALQAAAPVRTWPRSQAPAAVVMEAGQEVAVLGRFAGYLQVQHPSGRLGWIQDPQGAAALATTGSGAPGSGTGQTADAGGDDRDG